MLHNEIIILAQATTEGRVFGLDLQTLTDIGIQLLNGIVLAIALGAILYKPVKKFMQKRTDRIQGEIDLSNETMAEAQNIITEYNQKIEDLKKERVQIIAEARLKAEEESQIIRDEVHEKIEEERIRAKESIQAERERMLDESRIHIIESASVMAEKYIKNTINPDDLERIFDQALVDLEGSKWRS